MGLTVKSPIIPIMHSKDLLGMEEKKEVKVDKEEVLISPEKVEVVKEVEDKPITQPDATKALKDLHLHRTKVRTIIARELINSDIRLADYRFLLSMFVDLLEFRLNQKKEKIGFLKATINQITVAINVTQEMLDAINQ